MSEPAFVLAFIAAYLLGRLVTAVFSSPRTPRIFAAALAALLVADLVRHCR